MKLFMRDLPKARLSYARTPEECRQRVRQERFNIVLLDIAFAPNDAAGFTLVPEIKAAQPDTKIFMLSGLDDDLTVLRCLELGAVDFISKRENEVAGIANVLKNYINSETKRHSDVATGKAVAEQIGAVYASRAMEDVFARIAAARRNKAMPVLITGETGVGKDVVAMAIALGTTGKAPVSVDCGAIQETLAESEFFGHVRGSFTGADTNKVGKFQQAHGGDLFLDEIGNLKRGIQDKLLRAIQSKEITQVGALRAQKVDVRIIAATNENLDSMVADGRFRQDLLERLKGIWIEIPPLRERPEDIQPIAEAIVAKSGKPHLTFAPTFMSLLRSYSWRGNVRELEHLIREIVAEVDAGPITSRHLPEHFRSRLNGELSLAHDDGRPPHVAGTYQVPLTGTLEQAEAVFIGRYLADRYDRMGAAASKVQLARDLQISRQTLDTYLKKLGMTLGKADE
jgi:DNA-binding NtrC family response regulator